MSRTTTTIETTTGTAGTTGTGTSGETAGTMTTAQVIERFNEAFTAHDPTLLAGLVADECVMVSVQPAPEGTRYEGLDACLGFWQELAADTNTAFRPQEVFVFGDRAVIRWNVYFGGGEVNEVFGDAHAGSAWVAGVNLMHIRDGRIVEALGYSKSP
ncbi:nuclear transport factor 2 family protein [Embleya sp. NPDC050154]|uniref:nuclear transport factor 2 family protein n=1 Tax=Embleya sp. NPDC050154 TaxID=3363988 RepID=UPI00379CDE0C